MVRIPKKYGQSRLNHCPFCGKQGVAENSQGVPTCLAHKKAELILKCRCKEYLDILKGKWGPYCKCLNCGNLNFQRALEINPSPIAHTPEEKKPQKTSKKKKYAPRKKYSYPPQKKNPKEIVISSKDVDVYFS